MQLVYESNGVIEFRLDFEMAISEHYNEAISVIHGMFRHIFNGLEARYAKELAVVRGKLSVQPIFALFSLQS